MRLLDLGRRVSPGAIEGVFVPSGWLLRSRVVCGLASTRIRCYYHANSWKLLGADGGRHATAFIDYLGRYRGCHDFDINGPPLTTIRSW